MIQLFIGGVRSGKSDAAENVMDKLIRDNTHLKPAYIATSLTIGKESITRIELHQQKRQARFNQPIKTYELNYQDADLLSILTPLNTVEHVVLIECLSTWVGWYLTVSEDLDKNLSDFDLQQHKLLSFLNNAKCTVIIVTGEVGCGLIGETLLQRRYADRLGELNQKVAALSDHVYLATAGITQCLK